ncbi:MAG: metal-dependent hydrolase [Gemmatimonadota bacterium]
MDNLAHTLAGAALAETGLKRRTGLGTATLLIGANLPDLDVVALLFGSGLAFRRGWTHGVLALFVLPLLLTAAMLLWSRYGRSGAAVDGTPVLPRQLLLLAFVGVFSHPLLDWLNTYGLRWLMPFDGTWFYGDALFIVDPWLWLILLIGAVLARRAKRSAAIAAIVVSMLYAGGMLASSAVGRRMVVESMRLEGFVIDDVMVGPVPVNPNRRQVVIRDGSRYMMGTLSWFPNARLDVSDRAVGINADDPAARLAATASDVQEFLGWARFPFYRIEPRGAGYTVVVDDLRYSDGLTASWAAVRVEVPGGGGRRVEGRPPGSETASAGSP